jgi:hypothetical protein
MKGAVEVWTREVPCGRSPLCDEVYEHCRDCYEAILAFHQRYILQN